ncbi:MAG: restriction endonuclease subunit S [Evtepia gabavorous]
MAEQMKPSGIDWIKDIPSSWEINKVKYLATEPGTLFLDGDWIESDVIEESGIRYLTTGNVGAGFYKEQGSGYISEKTFSELHCLNVYPGDLMISRLNEPIGRSCIIPDTESRYVVAVDNVVLRPNANYNKKFIMYGMNADGYAEHANMIARGATMSRISRSQLGQFWLAFPNIEEQQAIADFLDKECAQIDSIAADLEKQIALLQQYKKSLITETVTKGLDKSVPMKDSGVEFFGKIPAHWKVSKTKYVADISIGLVTTMTANYVDEDGVPLIRNSNIRTNHIDDNGMVYLSKEFAKANIGRALHKGDIVTVHTGDVGTSAIINETYHMSHGFATIISRLKTKTVNNQFLCWLYNSEIFKEMSIAYSTGDGRQNLNLYDFVDFYILIPTLKEQMEIVNWLNLKCTEIDNFIENKQQQLLLIQQHKKSLIYEYVTGKKRVKEVQ